MNQPLFSFYGKIAAITMVVSHRGQSFDLFLGHNFTRVRVVSLHSDMRLGQMTQDRRLIVVRQVLVAEIPEYEVLAVWYCPKVGVSLEVNRICENGGKFEEVCRYIPDWYKEDALS